MQLARRCTDDVPDFTFDPKQCKYARRFSSKSNCVQTKAIFGYWLQSYYPALAFVAKTHAKCETLRYSEAFCPSGVSTETRGKILSRDHIHMNLNGKREEKDSGKRGNRTVPACFPVSLTNPGYDEQAFRHRLLALLLNSQNTPMLSQYVLE